MSRMAGSVRPGEATEDLGEGKGISKFRIAKLSGLRGEGGAVPQN